MFEIADELVATLNLHVIETVDVPARAERRDQLPDILRKGPLSSVLARLGIDDGTVWAHQASALDHLVNGRNTVVATGTASGKSLVFQLLTLHRVLENPDARVLIFYPLKALAADQHERWLRMAAMAGLGEDAVARIDGDMLTAERGNALDTARIVLMTPDVCQAWLMRHVGNSVVRRFFDHLALLVLDEAHVYESVFGSNVAFLLRRMIAAKRRASRGDGGKPRLQVIATTATIKDAAEHLAALTGLNYAVVDEDQNGAPRQPLRILHVDGAEYGSAGETAVGDLARGICELSDRRRFIAFLDSRQGVERTVRELDRPEVLPYRSGYEAQDRTGIETSLRSGDLHGVIATSALELGIDIADMEIGINLGVPQSRKSFRQRIGRVGRARPGVFFVIGGPNAFRQYGETFADYYRGSVEPSYLYLGNRFIQFAHARCLFEELEVLGAEKSSPPAGVGWPETFGDIMGYARPGGGRPREFDFIAQLGADTPHFNYPLRQVGEAVFQLKEGGRDMGRQIGNISANQAIREAYPGATYLHLGRPYKVQEWSYRSYDRTIRLSGLKTPAPTRGILRKTVTLDLSTEGIVGGRIKQGPTGLVAEVHLQVNESVIGYSIGNKTFLYKDLRAENPNMSRKQRDFRTTGILVKIEEDWFSGTKGLVPKVRERLANGILKLLSRDRSISPQDIDATHTNIALMTEAGPRRLTDAIVIYDSVYGGLRLTEDLFDDIDRYVTQLDRAADLAGDDALVSEEITDRLQTWIDTLSEGQGNAVPHTEVPDGWFQIYKPGSVVSVLFNGSLVERELVEPTMIDPFQSGTPSLFYKYRNNGAEGFVAHEQVQATGTDWSWALWCPESGELQDIDDELDDEGTNPS